MRSTPGVGSVVVAVLPRLSEIVSAAARPAEASVSEAAPVILVVDDDLASLKLADRALQALDYRVLSCPRTETALRAAAAESPAAVAALAKPLMFEDLRAVIRDLLTRP